MDLNVLLPCRLQTVSCPRISRDCSGWAAVYDEAQRAFYYHNLATDETTWIPPTVEQSPAAECSRSASASAEASSDVEQPVAPSATAKDVQNGATPEEPSVLGKAKKQGSRRRRRHDGPSSDDGEGRGRASPTKAQLESTSSGDGDRTAAASTEEGKASGGEATPAAEGNGEASVAAAGSADEIITRYGYDVIPPGRESRSRLMFRASSRCRPSAGLVFCHCLFPLVRGKLAVLSRFSDARRFVFALVRSPFVFLTTTLEGMDSEPCMTDHTRALLELRAGEGDW